MVRNILVAVLVAILAANFAGCTGEGEAKPTDAKIRADITSTLDANNIKSVTVAVQDSRVTLSGEVESQATVDRAVELARGTKGVESVTSQISVSAVPVPDINTANKDSVLAGQVQTKLLSDPALAGSSVTVTVAGGVATLGGNVPTEAARQAAAKTAKTIAGISSVVDQMQVVAPAVAEAPVPDTQLEAAVSELLDKQFPDFSMFVEVKDGVVALSGIAPDRTAIVRVTKVVHSVKGVKAVDTKRLTVKGGENEGEKIGSGSNTP